MSVAITGAAFHAALAGAGSSAKRISALKPLANPTVSARNVVMTAVGDNVGVVRRASTARDHSARRSLAKSTAPVSNAAPAIAREKAAANVMKN